jgi:hypothetical protein
MLHVSAAASRLEAMAFALVVFWAASVAAVGVLDAVAVPDDVTPRDAAVVALVYAAMGFALGGWRAVMILLGKGATGGMAVRVPLVLVAGWSAYPWALMLARG